MTSGPQASRVEERLGQLAWSLEGCREDRASCWALQVRIQVQAGLGVQLEGLIFPEKLGPHNPIPTTSGLRAGWWGVLAHEEEEEDFRNKGVVLELWTSSPQYIFLSCLNLLKIEVNVYSKVKEIGFTEMKCTELEHIAQ